ncbi:MAG: hypothetical protein Q8O00_07990, partial [Holophaga sp.]|nr:hypothetical protein [Holophaga sp.]
FKDIKAPKPSFSDDNEERKYKIVHSYCEQNWEPYQVIHVKDIITSFIIENSYEDFIKFIRLNKKECNISYAKLENDLEENIKAGYQKIYDLRCQLIKDRLAAEPGIPVMQSGSLPFPSFSPSPAKNRQILWFSGDGLLFAA